jgi:hypothetical protein
MVTTTPAGSASITTAEPTRGCSAYNIPINPTSENNEKVLSDNGSSVLDSEEIKSRGNGVTESISRDDVSSEIKNFLTAPFGLRREKRSLWTILMFLTTLPLPPWVDLHPGFLMNGMCYFPLIGSLLGIVVALSFDLAKVTLDLPAAIAAAISTAVGWKITNCFHEDGLCDSADGKSLYSMMRVPCTYFCYLFDGF